MKINFKIAGIVFLLSLRGYCADAQASSEQTGAKIKVILIGTFHWRPTTDNHKTDISDLYSAKRQPEINDLLKRLGNIPADKIFVEAVPERQPEWDKIYLDVQKGKLPDSAHIRNEIYQIAFKLALARHLPRIICVNNYPDSLFDDAYRFKGPGEKNYGDFLRRDLSVLDSISKNGPHPKNEINPAFTNLPSHLNYLKYDSISRHTSLKDFYRYLNSEPYRSQVDYDNWRYFKYNLGTDGDLTGADFASNIWYGRNFKIFVNILRHVDLTRDKYIVVLYGASHVPFLTYLFKQNPYFEVVEVNTYLSD